MSASQFYDTPTGRYRVPLLLFHPKKKLSGVDTEKITQHADILPTVLDYLNVPGQPAPLFGRSVFAKETGTAINQSDGVFWLIKDKHILQWVDGGSTQLFAFEDQAMKAALVSPKKEFLEKQLKAYIQYFRNSLVENSIYGWLDERSR